MTRDDRDWLTDDATPDWQASTSVVDRLMTLSSSSLEAVLHGLERLRGVPLPIRDLAHDPQRLPGAV